MTSQPAHTTVYLNAQAGYEHPPTEKNIIRPTWISPAQARRLDPLTKLSAVAIDRLLQRFNDCHLQDSDQNQATVDIKPPYTFPTEAAIIFQTSYGALSSTEKFLQSLHDYGDHAASPTPFTTSVHNATAGNIAQIFNIHGPNNTIAHDAAGGIALLRAAYRLLVTRTDLPGVLVFSADFATTWTAQIHPPHCPPHNDESSSAWAAWISPTPIGRALHHPSSAHTYDHVISSTCTQYAQFTQHTQPTQHQHLTSWSPASSLIHAAAIPLHQSVKLIERDCMGIEQSIGLGAS